MMNRIERIHILISVVVIAYVMGIQKLLYVNVIFGPYADQLIAFLTSLGVYRMLVIGIFWVINRSNFLLKLLWGKEYVNGIWTYSYELNGEKRFGIWRMAQDIYGVSITGYGLDKNKKIRSTFRSITPMFNNQGLYEITFLRTVVAAPGIQHIAKTTFYLDTFKRGKLYSAPKVIRAQTLIFGGPEAGTSHVDILARKQHGAGSEQQVLARLDITK